MADGAAVEASLARQIDLAAISRMAVALTQENPRRAMELLRAMLAAPRTWGSAIGAPSSLAIHAVRRGVRSVAMSLRPEAGGAANRARSGGACDGRRSGHPQAGVPEPRDDPAAA